MLKSEILKIEKWILGKNYYYFEIHENEMRENKFDVYLVSGVIYISL